MSKLDAKTIKLIKSRAPGLSLRDSRDLEHDWNEGRLLQYMETQQRNLAWERLKNIGYPIPTLGTFFQDILFLEVGQTVMRQLCLFPLKGNITIDMALRGQAIHQVSVLNSSFISETRAQNERLYDLWRFSLQYAFELTHKKDHHRRVPRKAIDKLRANELGLIERSIQSPLSLLSHFLSLARGHGFAVPSMGPVQYDMMEIPDPSPCYFPPECEDDVDIERRSGKPFTDCVDADRFALCRESLCRSWDDRRVSAGYVRRCVFNAFFSYLGYNDDRNNTTNQISFISNAERIEHTVRNSQGLSDYEAPTIVDEFSPASIETSDLPFASVSPDREAEFISVFGNMSWDLNEHTEG